MRLFVALPLAVVLAVPALAQRPPREQSPAPRDMLAAIGRDDPDAELARLEAEAAAHPLGTAENPVRVGGPEGEQAYIGRLRCGDGTAPKVGIREPAGIGAYGSMVHGYALDCGAAAPGRTRLVLDIYHEGHEENRAPAGFRMADGSSN